MSTATVRYGRPKGSGLNDRRQLETIAALLAADPKLKPTTAIRSLGVNDPSTIRRLRDKFRQEQARLMASARRSARASAPRPMPANSNESPAAPTVTQSRALDPVVSQTNEVAPTTPAAALVGGWCDLAFSLLSTAAGAQAAIAQHWLELPVVAIAVRRRLALNSMAVAVYSRDRGRRRILH